MGRLAVSFFLLFVFFRGLGRFLYVFRDDDPTYNGTSREIYLVVLLPRSRLRVLNCFFRCVVERGARGLVNEHVREGLVSVLLRYYLSLLYHFRYEFPSALV